MIKIVMSLVATALALTLLLSFKSQSAGTPKSALAGSSSGSGSGSGSGSPSGTATGPAGGTTTSPHKTGRPKAPAHPAGKSGTFTGSPFDNPYGTIQVAAVIRDGKLTDIKLLQETDGGRSHQIDDAAIPVLKSQALSKHSANIDVVSGATFTSQGYAQSLQSALDKAGI
ncbi:MAG: FMN-binding protein [Streptosporangiaceae bacterium]|nr:FMN-binding protein [Streptosporangiaceae bacterium]